MFEILFLGTSASAPSAKRGLSAQIITHNEYRFLIDCGEGTQRQILQSGVGFRHLTRILLTHGHLDHILGLGGLLSTFMRWEAIDQLEIFGGRATLDRVPHLDRGMWFCAAIRPPCRFTSGKSSRVRFSKPKILPSPPSRLPIVERIVRLIFETKARRPFLPEKADELGVPFGPERRDLVAGKTITLSNGRQITPDDVLGEVGTSHQTRGGG